MNEFLAAVLAAPDDDAPRLVYADWLSERGDPRGEYIACAIAGRRGRADERFASHGGEWTEEELAPRLGLSATAFDFARGFCERLSIDRQAAELVLPEALAALGRAPIRDLFVSRATDELGAAPALERLRTLELHVPQPGALAPAAERLVRLTTLRARSLSVNAAVLARLPALEELQLTHGVSDLSALGAAPRLRALSVRGQVAGTRGFAAWTGPARLERVELRDLVLASDELEALLAAPMLRDVVELRLDGCRLGDAGAALVAGATRLARLERLSLERNGIGRRGAQALYESVGLQRLTHLRLGTVADRLLRRRFGDACERIF